jgi:hypothetical protein
MRTHHHSRLASWGAALAAALTGGCDHPLCSDVGIDSHGRYRATVVALYEEQGAFTYQQSLVQSSGFSKGSCGALDGIGPGATLEFKATGTVDNKNALCKLITAEVVSRPPEIVPGDSSSQADEEFARRQVSESSSMFAGEAVTIGDCEGAFGVSIRPGAPGELFATPTPGQLPPALLYRLFVPTSGGCTPCDDTFVIQFTKE